MGPPKQDNQPIPFPLPGYAYRVGTSSTTELGLQSQTPAQVGFDLKWGIVRSTYFDLALQPSIHLNWLVLGYLGKKEGDLSFEPGARAGLSSLVNWNLSREVSLVPHGMVSAITGFWNNHEEGDPTFGYGGGLGVNWRVSPTFALHPDLSVLHLPERGTGASRFASTHGFFGMGVIFGRQPSF